MIFTDLEGDFDNPGAQDKFSFFIANFSKFLFFALAIIDCSFIVIVLLFVLVLVNVFIQYVYYVISISISGYSSTAVCQAPACVHLTLLCPASIIGVTHRLM